MSSESLDVSSVKQEIDLKPMISKNFNATNPEKEADNQSDSSSESNFNSTNKFVKKSRKLIKDEKD